MKLTYVEDCALQARVALAVGATTFDRLFCGINFDEFADGVLYAFAQDEDTAAEIEGTFSLHIAILASGILRRRIANVMVLPKILQ